MKPLPLPLRLAAGVAVTAAERARELPKNLVGLPVTVASQVLQLTMRLQQHVTELAIKGDEALSALRPVEEAPSWATFDEDLPPIETSSAGTNGHSRATAVRDVPSGDGDPWELEERALAEDHTDGEFDSALGDSRNALGDSRNGAVPSAEREDLVTPVTELPEPAGEQPAEPLAEGATAAPAGLVNYDDLTLPQLRARLRRFSLSELEEMLAYERAHEDRPSFVGMLTRRIGNVQRLSEGDSGDEA